MSKREYRVRWRREEKSSDVTQIFQTRPGALAKIDRLLALEEVKDDLKAYATMPDLVGVPVLESREVGAWSADAKQHDGEPTGEARSEWRASVHHEQEHANGTAALPAPIDESDIPF